VTIVNSAVSTSSSICNDGETTTTDLNNLLPAGISINSGTWIDINNSGGLQGSILMLLGFNRSYNFEYKVNDSTCPYN
jgi:hypothetical protein